MKNKAWWIIGGIVFVLAFFSSIRILVIYAEYLRAFNGNFNLAMVMMAKDNVFHLTTYITGGLHFSVAIIMLLLMLDK